MTLGATAAGDFLRAVVRFDLSSIAGRTATSCSLTVNSLAAAGGTGYTLARLTRTDWVESEVTWNDYASGSAWTTPGGDVALGDGLRLTTPLFARTLKQCAMSTSRRSYSRSRRGVSITTDDQILRCARRSPP
jgi:hypothetical protein